MASTHGFDVNFVPPWHVKSNADDNADVLLWADPTTHRLLVDAELTVDKDTADILIYANTAKDGSGTDYVPLVDGDGHFQVDVLSLSGTVDTELPAAVALADGVANPTVPGVGAFLMAWDGGDWARVLSLGGDSDNTSIADPGLLANGRNYVFDSGNGWDRWPGNTTNGADVDVTRLTDSIDGPGAPTIDSYTHASINIAAGNDQVLVSSAASKQIWVYGIGFTLSAQGTVSIQDEDNTAITGIMPFAQYSGLAISPSGNFAQPIWKLATDKDLEIDLATADLDGWIDYAIVSV